VLEQLNEEEFDTEILIDLIQHEPVITVKVIELANSSFYNRRDKEISDLKSEFMLLGINELMEGVMNGSISVLAHQSQIYFKQYGEKFGSTAYQQVKLTKSSMLPSLFSKHHVAYSVYEANIINELEMRIEQNEIDEYYLHDAKNSFFFNNEAKQYINKILSKEVEY
jgi:hypothetical protein